MTKASQKKEDKQDFLTILRGNKEFFSSPITIVLSAVALFFASQLLGGILATPVLLTVKNTNVQLLAVILLSTVSLYAILLLLKKLLRFQFSTIGFVVQRLKSFLRIIPAFLAYLAVSAGFTLLATHFIPGFDSKQAQEVGFAKDTTGLQFVAAFLSLVVITPVFEETIFRGLLFKRLRDRVSFKNSIIVASLVFAVAHMQWNVAVDTFALSLALCWLVEKTDSIVPSIALHMIKNGLAFTLLFVLR